MQPGIDAPGELIREDAEEQAVQGCIDRDPTISAPFFGRLRPPGHLADPVIGFVLRLEEESRRGGAVLTAKETAAPIRHGFVGQRRKALAEKESFVLASSMCEEVR